MSDYDAFGGYDGYLRWMVPRVGVSAVSEAIGTDPSVLRAQCRSLGIPIESRTHEPRKSRDYYQPKMAHKPTMPTKELDALIMQLRDQQGLTWAAIGSQVGMHPDACSLRYHSAKGIKRTHQSPNQARALELHYRGRSASQISELLGVSAKSVRRWIMNEHKRRRTE
jgi:hypothetical protein